MLAKVRKFGFYGNAAALPVVGNLVHKRDSTARLVANSIIAKAVVSAIAFAVTWKFTNNLKFAGIIAGSILGVLLLLQVIEFGCLKLEEAVWVKCQIRQEQEQIGYGLSDSRKKDIKDDVKELYKPAEKSAADSGVILGLATLGILPLISFIIAKLGTKISAKLQVSELENVEGIQRS